MKNWTILEIQILFSNLHCRMLRWLLVKTWTNCCRTLNHIFPSLWLLVFSLWQHHLQLCKSHLTKQRCSPRKQKLDWKKIVKLMDHNCACNDLTSFEYKVHGMTGNGSYWQLCKSHSTKQKCSPRKQWKVWMRNLDQKMLLKLFVFTKKCTLEFL